MSNLDQCLYADMGASLEYTTELIHLPIRYNVKHGNTMDQTFYLGGL